MYKDKYTKDDFKSTVINATKMLSCVILSDDLEISWKKEVIKFWLEVVCKEYNIEIPHFIFIYDKDSLTDYLYEYTGGGSLTKLSKDEYFSNEEYCICLWKKLSLMTFLHEFRHYMQEVIPLVVLDKEEDAREWSCSLFYVANPEAYINALNKGLLKFF